MCEVGPDVKLRGALDERANPFRRRRVACPDPLRASAKPARFRRLQIFRRLQADAEKVHWLGFVFTKDRLLHEMIEEPARRRALKWRAAQSQPDIAFANASRADRRFVGMPGYARKTRPKRFQCEWNGTGERRCGRERA